MDRRRRVRKAFNFRFCVSVDFKRKLTSTVILEFTPTLKSNIFFRAGGVKIYVRYRLNYHSLMSIQLIIIFANLPKPSENKTTHTPLISITIGNEEHPDTEMKTENRIYSFRTLHPNAI